MFSECAYFIWEIAAICYLDQRVCKTDHKIKCDTLLHNSICKNNLSRQPVILSMHKKLTKQQDIYPIAEQYVITDLNTMLNMDKEVK